MALVGPGAAAAARILPPGPEDAFGAAAIDLDATGRVAVAYERALPGRTWSTSRSGGRGG